MEKLKKFTLKVIDVDDGDYLPSKLFDLLIILMIMLSMLSIVLSTFSTIPKPITKINNFLEYMTEEWLK